MFHVPEENRSVTHPLLGTAPNSGRNGYFILDSPEPGWKLACIVSDQEGWEHVSIHAFNERKMSRTPTWKEMCFGKDTFWDAEDRVIQIHPRKSEYRNLHPNVLHLWRNTKVEYPFPSPDMVGPDIH